MKQVLQFISAAGFSLCVTSVAISQEFTYTESDNTGDNIALGYPVPLPVESMTPVDGFRTYNGLHMQHQQLAAQSELFTPVQVGTTFNGRPIWAYQLSDGDNLTTSGQVEASALINGGIHAREWQSPESLTGIMESMFEIKDDLHVGQYLLENLNLVLIPVLNVDGFLQTQRFPTTVVNSEAQPRDGRMRRKNMRDVDETLATTGDNLQGIDLNRNNNPYWSTSAPDRSSDDVRSIVHHGSSAASEPETQALQQGAVVAGEDRLRFYIDTHSFTQVYFAPGTNNGRRNALTQRVATAMRAVNNFTYRYGPSAAGGGIGATDEYFANTYQIPSYTLEIEPANSAADYGGNGVSHDGFILPNSEVSRMREETKNAALSGLYMITEIPFLKRIEISNGDGLAISQQWEMDSNEQRTLQTSVNNGIEAGTEYQLKLVFNKPMRHIEDGVVADFNVLSDAQNISLAWQRSVSGELSETPLDTSEGQWLLDGFSRYKTDTYQVTFTLPDDYDAANTTLLSLVVNTVDMVGQALDTNPATVVDWQGGHWQRYENTTGDDSTDFGGIDKSMRIIDDGSDLYQTTDGGGTPTTPDPAPVEPSSSGSGGGSFAWLSVTLIGVLTRRLCGNRKPSSHNL
ncbi:M14 family metallopeptidase [Thalassotalea euphylliae]|uniref:M14 family metallopeptidase n=1 Tax=Thalassotalea euphylliae TaxID=1655234 RepID=UPI00362507B8